LQLQPHVEPLQVVLLLAGPAAQALHELPHELTLLLLAQAAPQG
jgi:hypothetical protein